mmetsp:Transcript_17376/g.26662  ORF Transcript_17376/g.26662 Transcript_17376/m.26662 type:complete len:94 (+) Transcript_17376:298-579(+)
MKRHFRLRHIDVLYMGMKEKLERIQYCTGCVQGVKMIGGGVFIYCIVVNSTSNVKLGNKIYRAWAFQHHCQEDLAHLNKISFRTTEGRCVQEA